MTKFDTFSAFTPETILSLPLHALATMRLAVRARVGRDSVIVAGDDIAECLGVASREGEAMAVNFVQPAQNAFSAKRVASIAGASAQEDDFTVGDALEKLLLSRPTAENVEVFRL